MRRRPAVTTATCLVLLSLAGRGVAAEERIELSGSQIDVLLPEELPEGVNAQAALNWIETSARGVAAYFGRFPVPRVRVRVRADGREPVGSGITFGGPRPSIRVALGPSVQESDLRNDWVLTHEMTHLAFPDLTSDDTWAEEGLATYVEPLARQRAGTESEARMWKELVDGLPKGLPRRGGGGLHGTRDWGRTYWGGALFWLTADIEIHQATDDRKGLRDALGAILDAGGDIRAQWTLEHTLETGDRALGIHVLSDLYARMGTGAETVDLPELWRRLGIRAAERRRLTYDDHAPLAAIRRRIGSAD